MKMSSKLTPAAYTHKRLRYGGETDVNSVAMTMKPGYQQMTGMHNTQKQFSRTLVQKQNEISGRLHRDNSRENTTLHQEKKRLSQGFNDYNIASGGQVAYSKAEMDL